MPIKAAPPTAALARRQRPGLCLGTHARSARPGPESQDMLIETRGRTRQQVRGTRTVFLVPDSLRPPSRREVSALSSLCEGTPFPKSFSCCGQRPYRFAESSNLRIVEPIQLSVVISVLRPSRGSMDFASGKCLYEVMCSPRCVLGMNYTMAP